ncbi:MAG: RNA polymerase sigma factor [Bacteroidota bacterium]
MQEDEYTLIKNVQTGRTRDYEILVKRYQGAVYNLLLKMLYRPEAAEELTQEVFIKAYENLGSFNYKSRFFSWIYRMAINTAISYRKKEKRYVHPDKLPDMKDNQTEATIMVNERDKLLKHAISLLKENYSAVIMLKYYEALSYEEIAEVLEIPEKKVRSRLYDARRMLQIHLEKSDYFK